MQSDIPILIHHESNEKPSKGLGKNQSYLKYVIDQVSKYNERVVLFGDEYNKEWAHEWYEADSYLDARWETFEKVFVNMSTYPEAWAEGIFKRFFIFENFCRKNNIDEFFMLDSDVLIYTNLSEYRLGEKCDVALEWAKEDSFTGKYSDFGSVVAGIGYFKLSRLTEFIDFCISVYSGDEFYMKVLRKKWNLFQERHLSGGVCEMTLLYLWVNSKHDYNILNLLEPDSIYKMNNNFKTTGNYLSDEFILYPFTDIKRLRFIEGKPYLKSNNEWREFDNLHFGGDSKYFIQSICLHERISVFNYLYYVLIMLWRSKVKPALRRIICECF